MSGRSEEFDSFWSNQQHNTNDPYEASLGPKLGSVIRSIGGASLKDRLAPVDRNSTPQEWDRLIEHVQSVARQSREADERLRQREDETQNLLYSARKKLDDAAERVRAAEERAAAAEAQVTETIAMAEERLREAETIIAAAEDRTRHAEEAARTAEAWLHRVQHTIMTEFADMPTAPAATPSSRIAQGIRRVA